MRHEVIFGKGGTRKSTVMQNMIVWDIHNDIGLTALYPHAGLFEKALQTPEGFGEKWEIKQAK